MTPLEIATTMLQNDRFSQWLGIEIVHMGEGTCTACMTVREEMTNGFKIAHGGISFSLADSAFAFASNSLGRHAVSTETAIRHHQAVHIGDTLTAMALCKSSSHKVAFFTVTVQNQNDDEVAFFTGSVYRKSQQW